MITTLVNFMGISPFIYPYGSYIFLTNGLLYYTGYGNYLLSTNNIIINSYIISYAVYSFPTMYPLTLLTAFAYYFTPITFIF